MRRSLLLLILIGLSSQVWAQDLPTPLSIERQQAPKTFGLTTQTIYTVGAAEFMPVTHLMPHSWAPVPSNYRYSSSTSAVFYAPLRLPAGALIEAIELEGCDQSAVGSLLLNLRSGATDPVSGNESDVAHGTILTSAGGTPGCGFYYLPLPAAVQVDNFNRQYLLELLTNSGNSLTRFAAVRVYYRLQVSPAPAVATFADVPTTHPQFRFVQALVAAGITSGCGGGNFCPDASLTRGQMAVFLAAALGLHWAP